MSHDLCDPIPALSGGGVQGVLQEELSPQHGEGHRQGAGGGLQDAPGQDLRQQPRQRHECRVQDHVRVRVLDKV